MTEHHDEDDPAKLKPKEARSGATGHGVRYVLGISLLAIMIIMAIVLGVRIG